MKEELELKGQEVIPPEEEVKEETPHQTEERAEESPVPERKEEVNSNPQELLNKLEEKTLVLNKTIDALGGFLKGFDKTVDKINSRLDALEDKLPKQISRPKPTIKGYYDWDEKSRNYINEAARTDYSKARETIDIIKGMMK